jgi:hypothetical protein
VICAIGLSELSKASEESTEEDKEFQDWYSSLTTDEKILYQLEESNRRQRAIGGLIATHNFFDIYHDHH